MSAPIPSTTFPLSLSLSLSLETWVHRARPPPYAPHRAERPTSPPPPRKARSIPHVTTKSLIRCSFKAAHTQPSLSSSASLNPGQPNATSGAPHLPALEPRLSSGYCSRTASAAWPSHTTRLGSLPHPKTVGVAAPGLTSRPHRCGEMWVARALGTGGNVASVCREPHSDDADVWGSSIRRRGRSPPAAVRDFPTTALPSDTLPTQAVICLHTHAA